MVHRVTALLLVLVCVQVGRAQYVGGGLGIGTPHHLSTMRGLPGLITCCAGYTYGLGTTIDGHVLYRHRLTSSLSMLTQLSMSTEDVSFVADERVPMDGGGTLVDGLIRHTLSASMPYVSGDVLIMMAPSVEPRLQLGLGLRTGYILSTSYDQESRIIQPDNVRFENGARIRNAASGSIPDLSSLYGSVLGRIGWQMSIASLTVEPFVSIEVGFTNVVRSLSWQRNTYRAGVDVLIDLGSDPEPIPASTPEMSEPLRAVIAEHLPVRVTPARPALQQAVVQEEKRPTKLDMTVTGIDMYGDSVAADALIFKSVLSRLMAPILPYVFHDEGAVTPADRYLFTQSGSDGFNIDTLSRTAGILDIHYQSLNVIGERMRRHPNAMLTIVGNAAGAGIEVDDMALANGRAQWSRDYLVKTWGIDPNRITTSASLVPRQPSNLKTQPGWQENRRTEFYSATPEILEPFLIQDTVLSSNLALVKIKTPTVFDDVDVASWTVDIHQGSHQLASFEGKGAVPAEGVTWNLIDQRKIAVEDGIPVVMRLRVTTSDGETLEAERALPTRVDQRLRDRLEQYNLVVFGYNSADLTDDHLRITDKVRKMLGDDVEIKIIGYADKTGNADYNRRLSARRAIAVADAIHVPASMSAGVGFTDLLFDNTTPEGRFFCRTVRIFVKSNVK